MIRTDQPEPDVDSDGTSATNENPASNGSSNQVYSAKASGVKAASESTVLYNVKYILSKFGITSLVTFIVMSIFYMGYYYQEFNSLQEDVKKNGDRINENTSKLYEFDKNIGVTSEKIKNIESNVNDIKNRNDKLSDRIDSIK